jgi:predicted nucleotidyltransferase
MFEKFYLIRHLGDTLDEVRRTLPIVPVLGMIIPEMGKKSQQPLVEAARSGIADVLFTPVQQRVLALLFGQPDRKYQSGELIRLADSGTGAVHRLLTRMADTGLITVERVGNQKYYQANAESPVFEELAGLVRKTVGLLAPLQAALGHLEDRIVAAFVYGSVAKGTDRAGSDIDLMVVADDLDYAELFAALLGVEATLARPVNPNLMTRAEWKRRRGEPDSFAARIAAQPRLFVIGSGDDVA